MNLKEVLADWKWSNYESLGVADQDFCKLVGAYVLACDYNMDGAGIDEGVALKFLEMVRPERLDDFEQIMMHMARAYLYRKSEMAMKDALPRAQDLLRKMMENKKSRRKNK